MSGRNRTLMSVNVTMALTWTMLPVYYVTGLPRAFPDDAAAASLGDEEINLLLAVLNGATRSRSPERALGGV